jgi:putative oxidoreductase
MTKFLQMAAVPKSGDAGLLALRLMGVAPLLLKHGLEKVFTFSAMAARFPDPLHIGAAPSLLFAMLSDSICTVLMIVGLWTRWAALIAFVNVAVAWAFVHHFEFFGRGADHGELIVLYLAILATLLFSGAGKYSVDGALER